MHINIYSHDGYSSGGRDLSHAGDTTLDVTWAMQVALR